MKKSRKSILYLTMIILILAIAILVGIIVEKSYNKIKITEKAKTEQLTQTSEDNSYITTSTHLTEIENAYNNGYSQGYAAGQNNTGTLEYTYHVHGDGYCNQTPIYHTHSAQNTAPCYTRCSGVGSYYIDGTGMYFCYKCGRSLSNSYYSGQCAYYNLTCTKTVDSYYCSLDSNTIVSATIKYK